MSELWQQQAEAIAASWREALRELQKHQPSTSNKADFSIKLAFLGLHLGLRIRWHRCHDPQGLPSSAILPEALDLPVPWGCIFRPIAGDLAWLLVYGEAFEGNRQRAFELEHPLVQQWLIDHHHSSLRGQPALQVSKRQMGPSPAEASRTVDVTDFLRRFPEYRGADKALAIPELQCADLAAEWPAWWNTLNGVMDLPESLPPDDVFPEVAAAIWNSFVRAGLIAKPSEKRSFIGSIMSPRGRDQSFDGLALLKGDHAMLWDRIRADLY